MERARRVAATRILKDALDNGTTVPGLDMLAAHIQYLICFTTPFVLHPVHDGGDPVVHPG